MEFGRQVWDGNKNWGIISIQIVFEKSGQPDDNHFSVPGTQDRLGIGPFWSNGPFWSHLVKPTLNRID